MLLWGWELIKARAGSQSQRSLVFFGEDYVPKFISSKHCNIIILWIKLTVTA